MSKCKPGQDQAKIFRLDILAASPNGDIQIQEIEPIGVDRKEAPHPSTRERSSDRRRAAAL